MWRRWSVLWVALAALICLSGSTWAQDVEIPTTGDASWAHFWVDSSASTTAEAVQTCLDDLAKQQPEVIVVMLHGYDMGQEESTRMFDALARGVRAGLPDQSVGLVGLQWESGGGNIINPTGDYFNTLSRARDVGRGPLRQVLLGVAERFPHQPVALLTHSMGCEMAVAALVPEAKYTQYAPKGGTYEANREITITMAAFVGSDLDYDVWYQAGDAALRWFDRCQMTWSTLSDPTTRGDRVLSLRSRIRGKALGSLLPRMTQGQLDQVIPARRFYLDGMAVPANHAFDAYFNEARLARILGVLRYLTTPGQPEPQELVAMREVMETPDDLSQLLPFLDSSYTGAGFAALWRIERINCGDARHMSDQTLERAVLMLVDSPQQVWREQAHSECVTMRKGQYPTAQMMTRAGAPPWARPSRYQVEK